jgi:hypothetical protein
MSNLGIAVGTVILTGVILFCLLQLTHRLYVGEWIKFKSGRGY